jgi:hypothetical protein
MFAVLALQRLRAIQDERSPYRSESQISELLSAGSDFRLLMQNQIQQGAMDLNVAVIFNKAQLPKLVHEEAHARPRGADHLRQRLLADFRQNGFGLAFLPEICKKQEGSRQPLLAGVEQLIDQILLNATVASQEVGDE